MRAELASFIKMPLFILRYLAIIFCLSFFFVLFLTSSKYKLTLKAHAAGVYPPLTGTQHYFYTFTDGNMYVYDIDNNFNLVYSTAQPTTAGVRGMAVSPSNGMLYIMDGGAGGSTGNGGLLKYNLLTNSVVWQQNYNFGIDSGAISLDGKTIYLPDGEFSGSNLWYVIDAATGSILSSITAGTGPHNTVIGVSGKKVYMGGRYTASDYIADTTTNTVSGTIGPLKSGGRPFTVNGTETLAFTTSESYIGFQVSSITTGQVLYTVPVPGFTNNSSMLIPSHGISLSPDEKEIYLIDGQDGYAHVFDVSQLPNSAPTLITSIKLSSVLVGKSESQCAYDCGKEGWMLHSGDGRYVFVGDTGDVINTTTRTVVANIATLQNTRKYIEIDWQNGVPSFMTTRHGLGYVTTPTPTPTGPTPTPTLTPTSTPTPTPAPAGIVASDTFTRANQSLWGSASDGQVWGGDANTSSTFSISSNTGKVANTGGTSYNAILGPSLSDSEVLFTGSMSAYSSTNIGAVVRWQDTNNWYKAYIDGTNLVLQKRVNGSATTLKTAAFPATANTNYSLRFNITGTTLSAKVWITGQAEPTNWTATATDSTFASGKTGLRMLAGSGTASYTSFVSTNLSSISPTLTPTTIITPTPTPSLTPTPTPSVTPTPTTIPSPTPSPTGTLTPSPTVTPTLTPTPTPPASGATDYPIPNGGDPWGTTFDSQGNVWLAVPGCDPSPDCSGTPAPGKIQVFNPSTKTWIANYQLPAGYGQPLFLAFDANGNVWFPMFHTNTLGEFTPSTQTFQQWNVPTPGSGPWDVAVDHTGKVWFTEHYANQIGRFDPVTQIFTEIPTPATNSLPYGITVDKNNNIWFTENNGSVALIAQYTASGQLLEYKIRNTLPGTNLTPHLITIDNSGNIWWSEGWVSMIGELNVSQATPGTTNGVTEYAYPHLCSSCGTHTSGISTDSNGAVWFDDSLQSEFGSYSPATGQFTVYTTPTTNSHPHDGMNVDSGNNVWFDEEFAGKLAEFVPNATPTPTPTPSLTPTPSPTATPSPTPSATPTPSPTPSVTPSPTPTPVPGIIAQDTFVRPNQTYWGSASDGHVWGADAATNNIFTITGNTGQVKNGSTSYSATLGAVATNAQVLFTGSISSFASTNIGAVLRWSDTNNWYKAYIDGTNLVLQKRVNGTATILNTAAFAAVAGTNYSLRFQVSGTTLSAKVWITGQTEPSSWMATATDATFASGYCGLRMLVPGNTTASYTSFSAMSL